MDMDKSKPGNSRTPRRLGLYGVGVLAVASVMAMVFAGCFRSEPVVTDPNARLKLKVAYIGLTCEPPIFVAYEKGFFAEEGLDVELVKTDWDGLQAGLGLGRFHANHTLLMYILTPLESGLDVKITGGIHTGCLRIQAGIKTDIKTVADLKGRKIGISGMGSPPHLYASRVLAVAGMDPKKDVEWVTFPPDAMGLALDQGSIDAVASAEPIGTILAIKEKVRTVSDQAVDDDYKNEFCCAAVVNGKFASENPEGAAKVTRALLKGAKWVSVNPTAAAKLAVEKKYLAASPEINAQAISKLNYLPGVKKCELDVARVATDMKRAGFLKPTTSAKALAAKAWLDLPGVTDAWIASLKVEKVAGGGVPVTMRKADLEAVLAAIPACCQGKLGRCCDTEKSVWPLPPAWAAVRPTRLQLVHDLNGETSLAAAGR
jgi:NitT/TauT family transport system substrate-binding protein